MKYSVIAHYRNGLPLEAGKESPAVVGDLYLSDGKHPVMSRLTQEATLIDSTGRNLLLPMIDARVVRIAATTLLIRGVEVTENAQQVAQEWCCAPAPIPHEEAVHG